MTYTITVHKLLEKCSCVQTEHQSRKNGVQKVTSKLQYLWNKKEYFSEWCIEWKLMVYKIN